MSGKSIKPGVLRNRGTVLYVALLLPILVCITQRPLPILSGDTSSSLKISLPERVLQHSLPKQPVAVTVDVAKNHGMVRKDGILEQMERHLSETGEREQLDMEGELDERTEDDAPEVVIREREQRSENAAKGFPEEDGKAKEYQLLTVVTNENNPVEQTAEGKKEEQSNPSSKGDSKVASSERSVGATPPDRGQATETRNGKTTSHADDQTSEEKSGEGAEKLETTQSQRTVSNVDREDTSQQERDDKSRQGTKTHQEVVATVLPPRLAPSLSHITRPPNNSLSEPYDWKRPAMLTVLGIPEGDMLKLAVFSTGVDLIGFQRSFHFLGCLVGNKTYSRTVSDQRSPHFCLVDPEIPAGTKISLLLRRDETMDAAIENPLAVRDFTLENSEDDFLKLDEHVVIDDSVRGLAEGYEIVTIKSDVAWHEGLRERPFQPEKKRFELCLMTAMRQYPFLMQQWFDYYRQVGVDQIYVYDNVATEDLSQFDSDFVQTAFWPFGRSQHQSFNHFLLLSKNRCKYVGFFDADEYTFVGETGPDVLKRYVKKRMGDGYDQIRFPFIVMAGGGYVERPEGLLPDLYVRRNLHQEKFNVGKTILLSEAKWIRHGTHQANGGRGIYKNTSFELNPTSFEHNGMLVHYTKRSWEEFIMKLNTGGASIVTSARAPQNKTMQDVPSYYKSNESTVEYLSFRDQWRTIMKLPERRSLTLSWRRNDKECTQQICVACNNTRIGDETCN